ncbi:DUF817 domain-containing protein [Bacillus sp. RG28]|uniref:DUF817 domain-containing protein n=1 Tax=Gottfriedia endophytica TaxID=2820819 RepID=A0A940SKL4_9BACI|nr:DUF817 domain-containing protein [Gottfriedia endophytica]MBP0726571.1 DUF817 domain-containing protein [Gottfriedia endophytica]
MTITSKLQRFIYFLIVFTFEEAMCCLFPVFIFATLAISKVVMIPGLPRYDLILIVCILIQFLFIFLGYETKEELLMICLFHLIGICLEIFKVHMGSWAYPEFSYLKIGGVPLYSGFMYASVGSYICQAWKRFNLSVSNYPSAKVTLLIGFVIYANFFTHHFILDLRWFILVLLVIVYRRSIVFFQLKGQEFKMPLILSFFLIGFFIWIAENIATFLGAWAYPNQASHWQVVHPGKITSWFLLVIISFILVAFVNRKQQKREERYSYSLM